MTAASTEWLLDRGVTVMGIDQWGWDLPFHARSRVEGNWGQHAVLGGAPGRSAPPYWHMEQLTNLGALPPQGFEVAVFPLRIVGASAAPARVVAIFR